MRKVLANKIYDTDTAKLIGDHVWYAADGDFWSATGIFRKRNGEYFFATKTEAAGMPGAQEDIKPATFDEASAWIKTYLPELWAQEFVDGVDDGSDVAMTVRIPKSAKRKLDRIATGRGITRGQLVTEMIEAL